MPSPLRGRQRDLAACCLSRSRWGWYLRASAFICGKNHHPKIHHGGHKAHRAFTKKTKNLCATSVYSAPSVVKKIKTLRLKKHTKQIDTDHELK